MTDYSNLSNQSPKISSIVDTDIDSKQLLRVIAKQKYSIIVPTALVCGIALIGLALVSPTYKSSARILIESPQTTYTRPNAPSLQNSSPSSESIQLDTAQVQAVYMQSRDLAREVVTALKLSEVEEFNKVSALKPLYDLLGLTRYFVPGTTEDRVMKVFSRNLEVYGVEKTRIIAVDYSAKDPVIAAKIANTLAERYIERRRASLRETTKDASAWLGKEVENLQTKVIEAEKAVEAYKLKSGLFVTTNSTGSNSLSNQQLSETSTQYLQSLNLKNESEAKAKQIRELISSNKPIESSDIFASPTVQRLNDQITLVKNEIAQQSIIYLPGHPRIQQLNTMLSDYNLQIRAEAERVARGYENDAKIAGGRAEALSSQLTNAKLQASISSDQEVKLRELEREAKTQKDLLESMMARYRDAIAQQNLTQVPIGAEIISPAAISSEPDSPRFAAIMLASFLGTLLFSTLIVITRELMSNRPYIPIIEEIPTQEYVNKRVLRT